MRASSVLCLLALTSLLSVALATPGSLASPNTPTVDQPNNPTPEPMCLLNTLAFTNGLTISPPFNPTVFHYTCSCSNWNASPFSTQVVPTMQDDGSSAEITFNGAKINFRANVPASGISNGGANNVAPNSPLTRSSVLSFVGGQNVIKIGVGCNGGGSPETCYYEYTITCNKPDGSIVGDPQFVGLRGQSYQVHGVSGEIYNIVSDADLQYNSRFVFLNQGECPVVAGRKQKGCWSHPGSYLGELGLKTRAGDKIKLITGSAKAGFAAVEVNGQQVALGETVMLKDNAGSVSMNSTHLASVDIGNWQFAFENSDFFVNQRVRVLDARSLRSHGLLGQTWRETTYPNAVKYVQGQVDDYVIRDGDLFGDNFVFNTYN